MNFSTLIGLLAAAVIFIGTLFLTLANPLVFFEVSSILIVLGGTLAATLICFPLMQIVTLSKVFIPFFTTKPNGSGIGLSLSRQIMRLHGGSMRVESKPGVQTISSLFF